MHNKKVEVDLLSDEDKPTYLDILMEYLGESEQFILKKQRYSNEGNKNVLNRIKKNLLRREDKLFLEFTDTQASVFNSQWKYLNELFPKFKKQIKKFVNQRNKNVYKDLRADIIKIEPRQPIPAYSYDEDTKKQQIQLLKGQSEEIKKKLLDINKGLDSLDSNIEQTGSDRNIFENLYSEEKKKQYEQYIRKKNQQKIERHKKLDEQRRKQQEQQKRRQQEETKKEQQQLKQKKQEFLKKQMELHKQRDQEKKMREMRNSEYIRIRKNLKEKPPLYKKIINNYHQKQEYLEMEKRHRVLSENKSRYQHIDQMNIAEHQKNYETLKKQREEERLRKLQELMEQQKKSVVRHASMELPKEIDKQVLQKEQATQKQKKIKQYQEIVKQNFKPKINQQKRKQMLSLIEELELNSKHLKKTKLENGSIVYEEIPNLNPRQIGIKYLEKTKQMAAKARLLKSASGPQQKTFHQPKKQSIDYLAERRKIMEKSGSKHNHRRNLSSLLGKKSHLSFDEKINKVQSQSDKLKALNRQNQMKLKYGKFATSEQILTCKEQIDENYLQIAKMKLKLIKDS